MYPFDKNTWILKTKFVHKYTWNWKYKFLEIQIGNTNTLKGTILIKILIKIEQKITLTGEKESNIENNVSM